MGIPPVLGRGFREGDEQAPVAVLTYACWKRWGSNPNIIGQSLISNRRTVTIVGVAPKNFTGVAFGFAADVILPVAPNTDRTARNLFLIGRERDGVSLSQARADMHLLADQLAEAYPQADKRRTAILAPASVLPPFARSTAELISAVVIAMALMILLIACANVANLLLGLATGRKQEMLIRFALGATRVRLIRQLLTESAILCTAGGLIGFIITSLALAQFTQYGTVVPILGTLRFAANFRTNGSVFAMTLGLITVATLATGLTPAMYSFITNVAGALSGEVVIGGTRKGTIRNVLVTIQIVVCTLVMVGVGLCLKSLRNLQEVHLGFSPRNLACVNIDLQGSGFSETKGHELYGEIKQSASQLAGVRSNSLGLEFPLVDSQWPTNRVRIPGHREEKVPINIVDGDYFDALGIPLVAGRTFDTSDTAKAPEVVIINQDMAKTYWPGENPIDKQIYVGKRAVTVVGVVANSTYNTLGEPLHPVMYYALAQHYLPQLLLMVRTRGDSGLWMRQLIELVRRLGVTMGAPPFTSDEAVRFSLLLPTVMLRVIDVLGGLAMLLAFLGLYGAVFCSVNERRREIGIRVALGAQKSHLIRLFLRQIAFVSGLGTAVGLLLGVCGTILFRSQFYKISPVEIQVLVPVGIAMVVLSLGVAYAAARPWINLNPMVTLRHE